MNNKTLFVILLLNMTGCAFFPKQDGIENKSIIYRINDSLENEDFDLALKKIDLLKKDKNDKIAFYLERCDPDAESYCYRYYPKNVLVSFVKLVKIWKDEMDNKCPWSNISTYKQSKTIINCFENISSYTPKHLGDKFYNPSTHFKSFYIIKNKTPYTNIKGLFNVKNKCDESDISGRCMPFGMSAHDYFKKWVEKRIKFVEETGDSLERDEHERQTQLAQMEKEKAFNSHEGFTSRICSAKNSIRNYQKMLNEELKLEQITGSINYPKRYEIGKAILRSEKYRDLELNNYKKRYGKNWNAKCP